MAFRLKPSSHGVQPVLLHVSYQRRREKKKRRRQRMAKAWVKSTQRHQKRRKRRKRWKRKGQREHHRHLSRTLKHRVQGESPWLNPLQQQCWLPQLVR